MLSNKSEVIVAGHICLDIIPDLSIHQSPERMFVPGRLSEVGGIQLSTGGAVSNTGLSLHYLGVPTRLMGKVGNDQFGEVILNLLKQINPSLTSGMIKAKGEHSSYSIVLNFPNVDRIFLHCPGTNHTFSKSDVDSIKLEDNLLFHFGYPPLMKRMYENNGEELVELFQSVKNKNGITSLDMALPDADSESSKVDWKRYLSIVLPYVDIFLPSLEEILFMIRQNNYETILSENPGESIDKIVPINVIQEIAEELLDMGSRIVAIKLGEMGIYLRTGDEEKIHHLSEQLEGIAQQWVNRELWMPCFKTKVVGTTGAGDSTIAGFLMGILKNRSPIEVLNAAVAVGACCVEKADATSGILPWEQVQERIDNGWEKLPVTRSLEGFTWNNEYNVWIGPKDSRQLMP
ncbi:carbohydrate kinase family protein [Neobacillus ginsengisoli]|uniref:Sugar/nucleoside kinase (Ribokinase family) n=1 Tax=Neobacillus ginsengisoli TaxID=904295 RepID=A0ABT9XXJ0_9BACI|nr:carbohydrate kinase family protein [Neobacillus ginsengisoli]MDQ0200258.1 sugar/nucleoside kinase (ribokinase family) [Neobacillus ginsengisoli]